MTQERGLTWSGKWHLVGSGSGDSLHGGYSMTAMCGTALYSPDDPKLPGHLRRIRDGVTKADGVCKRCTKSVGVKTVTVELPGPTTTVAATEDENGARSWDYPHGGHVIVYDDGTIEWGSWQGFTPDNLTAAAAALLAAADAAERSAS